MRWLFRSSNLTLVSAALAIGAVAIVLWPRPVAPRILPVPVPEGDAEVVWLYAATATANWERFVTAVSAAARHLASDEPRIDLHCDDSAAFPAATTAIPELVLTGPGSARLHIRWYKLTSDSKTRDWVDAWKQRTPRPLAVIGGSSSDLAIELAESLRTSGESAPILLLTMATSDEVQVADGSRHPLTSLYPDKTFRFCFTNRQMADVVTSFIWGQDDLRPDSDPVYVAVWEDDPYSVDLTDRFCEALRRTGGPDWMPPTPERIPFSVGPFLHPNRWESEAANGLLDKVSQSPSQRRPLLVLPASTQPARRFLRALDRTAPETARRFVVATGDGIAFNALYRDRNVAWHVQDLPVPLVAFCHRNPVDEAAGFQTENVAADNPNRGSPGTGTEDLLLYRDLVEALVQAAFHGDRLTLDPAALAAQLRQTRMGNNGRLCFDSGRPLFDDHGNRKSGTGEHVVCLRPRADRDRVLPQAELTVWALHRGGGARWLPARSPLTVTYGQTPSE
jgi:hypothetical protein